MNLLAIDTSSAAQVIGLQAGDRLYDRTAMVGRDHSHKVLPAVLAVLDDAGIGKNEIDAIIFGQGPGSFTGLRIAVGVVQGLAYGLGIPVIPVSTLACLAQGAHRRTSAHHVVVALSARKREVFFGSYSVSEGIVGLVGTEVVIDVDAVPVCSSSTCIGVGDGWVFRDELARALETRVLDVELEVYPTAQDLIALGAAYQRRGQVISAMDARPEYLRERVATVPGELPQ